MRPRTVTCSPFSGRNRNSFEEDRNITTRICAFSSFRVKYRCPESGFRRLEISPSTQQSEYSRSRCVRTAATSARTVQMRRSGGRKWKPSWSVSCMDFQFTLPEICLLPEASDDVHHDGKHDTHHDAGGQRKIECGVLAFVNDIARKAPERQPRASDQHDN